MIVFQPGLGVLIWLGELMSEKLTFHDNKEFLLGVLDGEYTAEDLAMFSLKFEVAVNQFDGHCVLLDKTRFLNSFDHHDAILFADSPITDFMVSKGLRIAAVVRSASLDAEQFYETLMSNRSVSYKPFVSEKEAMDWLLK